MTKITAGWETDLSILRLSGSSVTEFTDHILVRSPHNPEYHWGNFILITSWDEGEDSERWLSLFETYFPEANWLALGLPSFPSAPKSWEEHGLELERMEVLKAETLPSCPGIPDPYSSRAFREDDWNLLLKREIAENLKSGEHDPVSFEAFIRNSIETYKKLCDQELASWFGAFFEDELVSDLGIVVCGKIGRYQSVQTDENHRKKGLASHLLGKAASWSETVGCEKWVIVTESTNDAGRVYRKAGFQPDLETVTAYRSSGK